MKSDHRHELKTNELADWLAHLPEWAHQNRTSLAIAAVVVVVAAVVYFWSFYRRDVVEVRDQTRLTSLVTQISQQIGGVAQAAAQNNDQSYVLVPLAKDLAEFAQNTSDNNMAAMALIERGEAIRAELHYRLAEISREELTRQIAQAQASYQQALDRRPSNPALAATAQFGLGLCEEELGNFDQAAAVYREVAQKPEYTGTAAQAAAAYRLKIMDDYKTAVVFKPAPQPKPSQAPAPIIQIKPGDANAPVVIPVPQDANARPLGPELPPEMNEAPASVGTPAGSEANAPAGG